MNEASRNTPASAMAEQAPKHERAIHNKLDAAVDETFPASDPVALTDPSRHIVEPRLPAHARPGDVLSPRGEIVPARRQAPSPRAAARPEAGMAGMLRWVVPFALAGFLLQRWWMSRRR